MLRELKFRVYIPDHEKFSYFELGKFDYSDRYLYQHNYPVQQCTGLKDKNGDEIYEGDIVEIIYGENLVGEVYFQSSMGTFRVKCNDKNSYPLVTYNIKTGELINVVEKVIGNIFENQELLKQ